VASEFAFDLKTHVEAYGTDYLQVDFSLKVRSWGIMGIELVFPKSNSISTLNPQVENKSTETLDRFFCAPDAKIRTRLTATVASASQQQRGPLVRKTGIVGQGERKNVSVSSRRSSEVTKARASRPGFEMFKPPTCCRSIFLAST